MIPFNNVFLFKFLIWGVGAIAMMKATAFKLILPGPAFVCMRS